MIKLSCLIISCSRSNFFTSKAFHPPRDISGVSSPDSVIAVIAESIPMLNNGLRSKEVRTRTTSVIADGIPMLVKGLRSKEVRTRKTDILKCIIQDTIPINSIKKPNTKNHQTEM